MKHLRAVSLLLALVAPASAGTTVLPVKSVKILPTKDVVVIGWIRDDITLPILGVDPALILALNGPLCSVTLGLWVSGVPANLGTQADIDYANAFLIKYSANGEPPPTIDPDAYDANGLGDYRLFNRFKIAHRAKDGKVVGAPKILKARAVNGRTPDPCHNPLIEPVDSEPHVANGTIGKTTDETGVYQIAEGRVGTFGQSADTTINDLGGTVGATTPWIWSVVRFDTAGNLVFPFAVGNKPNFSMFPTFYVYEDGQRVQTRGQGSLSVFVGLNSDYQISAQVP